MQYLGITYELFDAEGRLAAQVFDSAVSYPMPPNRIWASRKIESCVPSKDLGHGRFDPYVVPVLIGKSPDQHGQRFHGKEMPGRVAQPNLLSLPLCQRFLEGDAGIGSVDGRLPCLLGHAGQMGRNADPRPTFRMVECIFQSLADFADDVFDRDLHLLQRDVGILDASAAFELTPLPYQQSRCGHVENKRRGTRSSAPCPSWTGTHSIRPSRDTRRAGTRDERNVAGDWSIGAPELFTVDQK